MDDFGASEKLFVFSQNAFVHVCDFFLCFFSNSSDEHFGSDEEIPQQPWVANKAKVAERKSAKPLRAPKKKDESEFAEDDDIPSAHSE